MKKLLLTGLFLLTISSSAFAQIKLGLGLAVPLSARNIVVTAHVDNAGVVHVDKTLDASPQILVELHRTFKVNKDYEIGPVVGFCPKIDFGSASNSNTEHLVGAGFGLVITKPVSDKKYINIGVMWIVSSPVSQVNPEWREGFQAPRTNNIPLDVRTRINSVNRIMFTMTISGLF